MQAAHRVYACEFASGVQYQARTLWYSIEYRIGTSAAAVVAAATPWDRRGRRRGAVPLEAGAVLSPSLDDDASTTTRGTAAVQ